MRLFEINSSSRLREEEDETERNLTPKEMQFLVDMVKDEVLTKEEIAARIKELTVDWARGKNSLRHASVRMHAIIHGILPLDLMDSASWFAKPPNTMIRYAESQGFEAQDNWEYAQIEASERAESQKKKRKKQEAMAMMSAFFQENKERINVKAAKPNREQIIADLMDGAEAEEAFQPYMK